uniref:Reverse transcriptase domain-containing protein n=1 Tax=Tanacetum cinerariifolium TaxID=118510 RepID=A0A6L2JJF6_TANCI|nr:reverse transcriptase domain-containing protein [Tanacetum cinerariifolium]
MSDSEDSTVTYMEVSSPLKDLSDIGSPGVDGLPAMPEDPYAYVEAALQAPPSPDYVPSPEQPEQAPPLPDFVPELVYPEFTPLEDDVLLAKEQPLPAAISPTTNSQGYITESDPEEDPKEDDEDPKEDPTDYPTDREDDEEKDESSRDDANNEEEDEDQEEEEHPAPTDSSPPPPPVYHTTARISIPTQAPIPFLSKAKSYLSIGLPRASMAMMRAATPSIYILAPRSETSPSGILPLLPIPLPTSLPPLPLPSTNHRSDVLEVTLPPRKRLCIAIEPKFEVKECSSPPTARPTEGFRADYGFVSNLDAEIRRDPYREIGYMITNVWEDPDDIAEEIPTTDVAEFNDRLLMSGQLNSLRRDRRSYARATRHIESEARASREAWVQSMDASNTKRSKTQMVALQSQQRQARDTTHPLVPKEAKMAPKRTPRSTPATTTTTTTTTVTDAQLKALIDQGVANALAARDIDRSQNGKDNHDSGTGVRRPAPLARECTYPDFMKCKPLYFKGTEGVVELTQWMFPEESDKIERYVDGLPDMIHRSVMASKPKTMQDTRECPKLKNNNHGNQGGNGNAPAKVYVVGNAGINLDSNVVMDHYYDVELVDERIVGLNNIIRGCRLNFLNDSFNIDVVPIELGSFDVIIGMDWLAKHQAIIIYAQKIIRIPWGNETLIIHGDRRDRGNETRLNIISCTKMPKYMLKGCHVFLAHVTTKETEDKSKEKQLEDISIV